MVKGNLKIFATSVNRTRTSTSRRKMEGWNPNLRNVNIDGSQTEGGNPNHWTKEALVNMVPTTTYILIYSEFCMRNKVLNA